MSALANTQANHSINNESTHHHVEGDAVEKSTTSISVTARIDYIQRFSKQMTVVVAQNPAVYAQLARQYLANISQDSSKHEINVAFVAASSKLNDIQMRCRLIEQLFANTLFDPEQSLAVSILRLAKQNNDTITVVVEHAQALSLQIKYELCQLVDVAKKTQNNINVVIFGLEQAAQEIGQNKTIFNHKASIIDASSGQVLALDHARFKGKTAVFKKLTWLKISFAALTCILMIFFSWFLLAKYNYFSLTTLPVIPAADESPKIVPHEVKTLTRQSKLASVADVHFALQGQDSSQPLPLAAKRGDILQALVLADSSVNDIHAPVAANLEKPVLISTNTQVTAQQVSLNDLTVDAESNASPLAVTLTEQYYLNSDNGYVVQITGFSDLSRLEEFIKQNKDLEYFSYQKNLNSQKFIVLTSKIFSDKAEAKAAMNELPQVIRNLGSFLKSVSIIKGEINTFNR